MTTRSGQDVETCTPWICVMVRTRAAIRAVFTRISGVPGWISAAARTSDSGTRCVPVTTTERTAKRPELSSAQVTPPAMPAADSRRNTASHRRDRARGPRDGWPSRSEPPGLLTRAASRGPATSCGPSAVTSPAPMVSTTSPGSAIFAITWAACARSGRNTARPPGTASATSLPVTPGSGSSRAA